MFLMWICRQNTPFDPKTTAVVVVDLQKDFYTAFGLDKMFPNLPSNVQKLFKFCRATGLDLIHIHAVYNNKESPFLGYYNSICDEDKKLDIVSEY